jgi:hypothetical protein
MPDHNKKIKKVKKTAFEVSLEEKEFPVKGGKYDGMTKEQYMNAVKEDRENFKKRREEFMNYKANKNG